MVFITGSIQFILILFVIIYEYKRKSPSTFMWGTLLVVFGFPHLLYSYSIVKIEYTNNVLNLAATFVILFTILYLMIRVIGERYILRQSPVIIIERNHKIDTFLLTLLIIIVLSSIYDAYQYSGSFLNTSWSSRREMTINEQNIISKLISSMKYAASSIILIYLLYREKKVKLFLPIMLIIFYSIISRRRIDMLPIIVSFIASYMLVKNNLKIRYVLLLFVIGAVALYAIYAMQIFRYGGSIESFVDLYSDNWRQFHERVVGKIFNGEGELGLQKVFYFFIEKDNNYPGFEEGHTYIRLLMFLIPTEFSFGLKPSDFAITMGSFWNPSAGRGYSVHPSLFGDCYANFGFYGVLLGVFWGFFSNVVDKILYNNNEYTYYPLFLTFSCCFVIIGRGSVYNGFFVMAIVYIIIKFLLSKIFNKL